MRDWTVVVKSTAFGFRETWLEVLALTLIKCVALGSFLNPILKNSEVQALVLLMWKIMQFPNVEDQNSNVPRTSSFPEP